jgi:LysM repeat protein
VLAGSARRRILPAVERICPFLALESDAHVVVAGYDPEHRCGALLPHEAIERARQLSTCLEATHTQCPRFAAAMQVRAESMPWTPPSQDAELLSTRLVLGPESALRTLARGGQTRPRRLAIGAAAAAIGMVAVTGGVLGALGALGDPEPPAAAEPSVEPTPSTAPASMPAIGGRPDASVPAATAVPTPRPSPTPASTPTPAPSSPTPAPARTYVVREGDTLWGIADAYGVSVVALMVANDIEDSDVILIGQELVIP